MAAHLFYAVGQYRPGSADVTNAFFEDLSDILQLSATLHILSYCWAILTFKTDIAENSNTIKWQSLLRSMWRRQRIVPGTLSTWSWHGPTAQLPACRCYLCHCLTILSSQSTWTCSLAIVNQRGHRTSTLVVFLWLRWVLQQLLLMNAPDDFASLVKCYNSTLQSLLNQHAPFAVVKSSAHILCYGSCLFWF